MHATSAVATAVLADPAFNTSGIVAFLVKAIIPIIITFLAILILARAHRGQTAQNFSIVGNVILGCLLLGGAGAFVAFGGQLVTLIFG